MLCKCYSDNNNTVFLNVNRLLLEKETNNIAICNKPYIRNITQPKVVQNLQETTRSRRKYNVTHQIYRLGQAIGYKTKGKQEHVVHEELTLIYVITEMYKQKIDWTRKEITRRYKFKTGKTLSETDLYKINNYISNLKRLYFLVQIHQKHNTIYGKDFSILLSNSEILKGGRTRGPKELSLPISGEIFELCTHDIILFFLKQLEWTIRKRILFEKKKIISETAEDFEKIVQTIKTEGTINGKFRIVWFKYLPNGRKLLRGKKDIKDLYIEACQISKKVKIKNEEMTLDKLKSALYTIRKLGNAIYWLINQEREKYDNKYIKKDITPKRLQEINECESFKTNTIKILEKLHTEKRAKMKLEPEFEEKPRPIIIIEPQKPIVVTRETLIQQFWQEHFRRGKNIANFENLPNPNQITKKEIEDFIFQARQMKIYTFWKFELREDINNLTWVENRDNITREEIENYLLSQSITINIP